MQKNGFSSALFLSRAALRRAVPSAGFIWARLEPHQPTSGITRSTGDSLESFTVAKSRALRPWCDGLPSKRAKFQGKRVEGAQQRANGKWGSPMFPGRQFDDLDAYRAAKKQRAARMYL